MRFNELENPESNEEFDPRERPEERKEMEEFAHLIIGPDWRDTTSRKELVDTWIMFGGDGWRENADFLKGMYHEVLKVDGEQDEENIPQSEYAVLGTCIEPTERLYEVYRAFDEPACVERNKDYERHGFDPVHVLSFDEWVRCIEDWKRNDPAELYRKVSMWNMGYEEFRQQLHQEVEEAMNRTIAFFRRKGAKIDLM